MKTPSIVTSLQGNFPPLPDGLDRFLLTHRGNYNTWKNYRNQPYINCNGLERILIQSANLCMEGSIEIGIAAAPDAEPILTTIPATSIVLITFCKDARNKTISQICTSLS